MNGESDTNGNGPNGKIPMRTLINAGLNPHERYVLKNMQSFPLAGVVPSRVIQMDDEIRELRRDRKELLTGIAAGAATEEEINRECERLRDALAFVREELERTKTERNALMRERDLMRMHVCKPPLGNPTREEAIEECARLYGKLKQMAKDEQALSDAYLRIRMILDAWDTPKAASRETVWAHVESRARYIRQLANVTLDSMFKPDTPDNHEHCWHVTKGPLMIALPDGHVHQTCCRCPQTRHVHADHLNGSKRS